MPCHLVLSQAGANTRVKHKSDGSDVDRIVRDAGPQLFPMTIVESARATTHNLRWRGVNDPLPEITHLRRILVATAKGDVGPPPPAGLPHPDEVEAESPWKGVTPTGWIRADKRQN